MRYADPIRDSGRRNRAATGLFGRMPEGALVLIAASELGATNAEFGPLIAVTPIGAVLVAVALLLVRGLPSPPGLV